MNRHIFNPDEDIEYLEFFKLKSVTIDDLIRQLELPGKGMELFAEHIDGFHLYFQPYKNAPIETHYYSRNGKNVYKKISIEYEVQE